MPETKQNQKPIIQPSRSQTQPPRSQTEFGNAIALGERLPQRPSFVALALLLILYFISRLWGLTRLPAFIDESGHINWAVKMAQTGQYLGITDAGKFFGIWILSLGVPFANNLLWVERFIAVGIGAFSLLGCYLVGQKLFDPKTGYLTAGLYLLLPYTFFHDRMVLVDGLMTALAIYMVFFTLMLFQKPTLKYTLALGLTMALTIMTKFNGFTLSVLPLLIIAIHFVKAKNYKLPYHYFIIAYVIAVFGFAPLLFDAFVLDSSAHWMPAVEKSWARNFETPFWQAWLINLKDTSIFLLYNLSPIIFVIASVGCIRAIFQRAWDRILLLALAGVTIGLFVIVSEPGAFFPRYLLPAIPFLLLLTARTIVLSVEKFTYNWQHQPSSFIYITLILLLTLPGICFNYWLIVNPAKAPLVKLDNWQYINGWPSGYGLPEATAYLKEQLTESEEIIIIYDNQANKVLTRSLPVYLYAYRDRITFSPFNFSEIDQQLLEKQLAELQHIPVFVILDYPAHEDLNIDFETSPYAQLAARFYKPDGQTGIDIYVVSSPGN